MNISTDKCILLDKIPQDLLRILGKYKKSPGNEILNTLKDDTLYREYLIIQDAAKKKFQGLLNTTQNNLGNTVLRERKYNVDWEEVYDLYIKRLRFQELFAPNTDNPDIIMLGFRIGRLGGSFKSYNNCVMGSNDKGHESGYYKEISDDAFLKNHEKILKHLYGKNSIVDPEAPLTAKLFRVDYTQKVEAIKQAAEHQNWNIAEYITENIDMTPAENWKVLLESRYKLLDAGEIIPRCKFVLKQTYYGILEMNEIIDNLRKDPTERAYLLAVNKLEKLFYGSVTEANTKFFVFKYFVEHGALIKKRQMCLLKDSTLLSVYTSSKENAMNLVRSIIKTHMS